MTTLFSSDEDFLADVAALQAAYKERCEGAKLKTNVAKFCTAAASGARQDWAFNAPAVSK
jgi:hypothetical protein